MTERKSRRIFSDFEMDHQERYRGEKAFTDEYAAGRLAALSDDLKTSDVGSFEGLCETIDYLRSIPPFFGDLSGKRVLDVGCGDGWISLRLAKSGARVWACDISPKIVELAGRYAEAAGLEVTFESMICEEMTYDDDFFDMVIMHFALHHCDIEATARQINRVLKPGGKAALMEDYAYHPLFRLYRALTPGRHSEFERPLTEEDISLFTSFFSSHALEYSGLLNVFEGSNNRLVAPVRSVLRGLDSLIYEHLRFSRRYSRIVIMKTVK